MPTRRNLHYVKKTTLAMLKKVSFLLAAVLLLCQNANAQWANVTPQGISYLQDVSVVDAQTAFVLSADSTLSTLYRSIDGGQSWELKTMPEYQGGDPYYWRGVQFLNQQTGFVYAQWLVDGGVYNGGTQSALIYKTTDGGDTWQQVPYPVPTLGFAVPEDLFFFNEQQAVITIVTGLGKTLVQTTDDGGQNWIERDSLKTWESDQFYQANGQGAAIRYQYNFQNQTSAYFLYNISNFGQQWTPIGAPGIGPDWPQQRIGLWYDKQYFVSEQLGYRTRVSNLAADQHLLDRTTDGGQNWETNYFSHQTHPLNNLFPTDGALWAHYWDGLYRIGTTSAVPETPAPESLSVFPQPAGKEPLQLQLGQAWNGRARCRILSAEGRICAEQEIQISDGRGQLLPGDLPAGAYSVQVLREQAAPVVGKLILR
jgi:photosystem II stability/assembly factor-like uncharacterized protein